jgi:hypothetical protein
MVDERPWPDEWWEKWDAKSRRYVMETFATGHGDVGRGDAYGARGGGRGGDGFTNYGDGDGDGDGDDENVSLATMLFDADGDVTGARVSKHPLPSSSGAARSSSSSSAAAASVETIDFMCGNEVALFHHTGMLLSLLRADPFLKVGLVRHSEEELRGGICREGAHFGDELRQADTDAALRLNLRTVANLEILRSMFRTALLQLDNNNGHMKDAGRKSSTTMAGVAMAGRATIKSSSPTRLRR